MAQHYQQRWILVGGLGLTASLGLLHLLGTGFSQWTEGMSLPLFALMVGGWWWQRRRLGAASSPQPTVQTYDRAVVEQVWTIVDTQLEHLEGELPETEEHTLKVYQHQRQSLSADLDRQTLTLTITGSQNTGKTTLAKLLQSTGFQVEFQAGFHSVQEAALTETATLLASDALIVLTGGDLTQSELNALIPLAEHPGLVVAVNKQDQYLPDSLGIVVAQVEAHLQEHLPPYPIPVVTIASQPMPLKRRKMEADGTWQEQWHQPEPLLTDLWPQLQRLKNMAPSLICATTYRQTQTFKQHLHHHLNQVRRPEALRLIQKAQGIAAIATGVNPIPTLDLLAGLAVNGQLVVDLAHLYRQPLSLKDGETVAKTLAALLVKLGLVELSTQILTPLLKAHHATYLAGAVLQGISAAYLTRVAGLAIVEYLEHLEPGTQVSPMEWRNGLPTLLKSSFDRLKAQDCRQWLSQTVQTIASVGT